MAGGPAFSRRAVAWVSALAVGSFLLALVFVAFPGKLGEPASCLADAFSTSAIGHRAAVHLLRRSGLPTLVRRTERPGALGPGAVLVVSEPPAEECDPGGRVRSRLEMARLCGASVLLVLPKWRGVPHPVRPRWIEAARPIPLRWIARVANVFDEGEKGEVVVPAAGGGALKGPCTLAWGGTASPFIEMPLLLRPSPGLEPLVSCAGGILVGRLRAPGPSVCILADPDLFNTHGLGRADNARLFHDLLARGLRARTVVWDETIHGFSQSGGLLGEAFRFPLVLAVGHFAVLLGAVLWAGAGRMGKPRRPDEPASHRRTLVENTAALLGLSPSPLHALRPYAVQTLRAIGAHYFLGPDLPEPVFRDRLRALAARRGSTVDLDILLAEVDRLETAPAGSADSAVALAVRLHRFREEMTHVR